MITGQQFWELGQVADERLLEGVRALVRGDRRVTARLLAHLAEVEERRLHLKQAKSSMFEYCLELGMSEDEAGRRLCAARVAQGFPEVYRMLDEGRLCLSVICGLKQYLTEANHTELLQGVSGMSYRKAAEWLAGRFPSPDKPSTVRKLPERARASATTPTTFETVSPELATSPGAAPAAGFSTNRRRHRSRVEPLATARFRVEFTASAELTAKLKLAADLMAHRNPSRDFEPIFEQALDLLIAKLEKQRFAETDRPAGRRSSRPETVTNDTRRAVLERDGLQCSFVDDQGRRCTARAFLERDHIRPRGKGGGSGPDNIRHLCRAHNQWLAEIEYGREHIERAKKAKRRRVADATATSRTARSASSDGAPDTG